MVHSLQKRRWKSGAQFHCSVLVYHILLSAATAPLLYLNNGDILGRHTALAQHNVTDLRYLCGR